VVVRENGSDVQSVTEAAETQSQAQTDLVGDTPGEETHDGEGGVDGSGGIVNVVSVDLTGCTQAVDGVEHARAQEAHEGDEDDLELRSRVSG